MSEQIQEIKLRLRQVKLWIVVAALAGTVLLSYYSLQAKQYWDALQEAKATTSEIELITRSLKISAPEKPEGIDPKPQFNELDLEALRGLFSYPTTDELMSILSTTSAEVPVDLVSIAMGRSTREVAEGLSYETQPVSIALQGSAGRIFTFLSLLQDHVPSTEVSDIRITSASDAATVARVQIVFYLSPQTAPDEESAE